MTTTTRNEAGERLRVALFDESDEKGNHLNLDDRRALLDEALAAERRATVERIRATLLGDPVLSSNRLVAEQIAMFLDGEAAR